MLWYKQVVESTSGKITQMFSLCLLGHPILFLHKRNIEATQKQTCSLGQGKKALFSC